MGAVFYKESELYNGIRGVFAERYIYSWVENWQIGLCTNAEDIFCRVDDCSDKHCVLSQTNCSSSWLKEFDTICPKIAWGITAWILYYSNTDDKGRLRFYNNTRASIFNQYKNECELRYKHSLKDEYDYLRENGDVCGANVLDSGFLPQHIEKERTFIQKFAHHECIAKAYYDAVLQCAYEYIGWIEENGKVKQTEVKQAPSHQCELYTEEPTLNYGGILDYLKKWKNSSYNTKGTSIVSEELTTSEFCNRIRNADVSVISKVVYRDFITLQFAPYFPDGWMDDVVTSTGRSKKRMSSNTNKLCRNFTNPFNLKKYESK